MNFTKESVIGEEVGRSGVGKGKSTVMGERADHWEQCDSL